MDIDLINKAFVKYGPMLEEMYAEWSKYKERQAAEPRDEPGKPADDELSPELLAEINKPLTPGSKTIEQRIHDGETEIVHEVAGDAVDEGAPPAGADANADGPKKAAT